MKYLFFDPHPGGVSGAVMPLPPAVKRAIDRICAHKEGLSMKVAMALLEDAVDAAIAADSITREPRFKRHIYKDHGAITLHIGDMDKGDREDVWRLMKFRKHH